MRVFSALAWIDNSLEEQRQIREMLRLFALRDSRDELGLGQVRDVFSDLLFPGTSVLHTRARYLLFVPWCEQQDQRRGSGSAERSLIASMQRDGATEGLIGSRRGIAVRTLPSVVYRSALLRFGILTEGVGQVEAECGDDGELVERATGPWHRELPAPPAYFPAEVAGGFDLTTAEASWLRERILHTTRDSLLSFLLEHPDGPERASVAPWADPTYSDLPEELVGVLEHAELFSLLAHGAQLLYNLLLGRRYEAAGYTEIVSPVADFEDRLTAWADWVAGDPRVHRWNQGEFWDLVLTHNPRISVTTREFVNAWAGLCEDPRAVVTDRRAHELVAARERWQKKAQSRFTNDELLRRWSGASGAVRMTFRWAQASRLVTDIRNGLERTDAVT